MSDSLGDQQAALVAALVLGGATPAGLDDARVTATRRQLLDKRARVVAGCWPDLAAAFGPRWGPEFAAWARDREPAGPRSEGYRFAVHLARQPRSTRSPEVADQIASVLLDWRPAPPGLRRRRGLRVVRVLGRWRVRIGCPPSR